MRRSGLAIVWIALPLLLLAGLWWELITWRSLTAREKQAESEKNSVTAAIKAQDEEMGRELTANAGLLREMQWSADHGDPSAFLTRLAELAQGARLKVTAIGPLERQATPQFSKSWHSVQVVAPYRELRELATRIERDGGILDDVLIEASTQSPRMDVSEREELQARFKLTAMELTGAARAILQRVVTGGREAKAEPSLALPLPQRPGEPGRAARDPFAFVVTAPPRPAAVAAGPRPGAAATQPAGPPKPLTPMEVKGIVNFPGGYLAILNNQIVRVGDVVAEHRVERITDSEVVLRQPDGSPRTVTLPDLGVVGSTQPKR